MAINKQTIISAFDDKLTLLQWLKTINKALDEAVLTGVEVRQKGNATYSFVVTFEDGTELESNEFVLAQGESINGATIRNGHLYLSLTNGNELDAGNLKPVTSFEINASQHLIVNYGDGTSQDLGAIFSGNVNIDGNFTANSIIQNMTGTTLHPNPTKRNEVNISYAGICQNGNKLTIAINGSLLFNSSDKIINICNIIVPLSVGSKIIPYKEGTAETVYKKLSCYSAYNESVDINTIVQKDSNSEFHINIYAGALTNELTYYFRYEITFLLSDNLAGN